MTFFLAMLLGKIKFTISYLNRSHGEPRLTKKMEDTKRNGLILIDPYLCIQFEILLSLDQTIVEQFYNTHMADILYKQIVARNSQCLERNDILRKEWATGGQSQHFIFDFPIQQNTIPTKSSRWYEIYILKCTQSEKNIRNCWRGKCSTIVWFVVLDKMKHSQFPLCCLSSLLSLRFTLNVHADSMNKYLTSTSATTQPTFNITISSNKYEYIRIILFIHILLYSI